MVLHQTLHGYSDGHRLLQSSLDLDSSEKKSFVVDVRHVRSENGQWLRGIFHRVPDSKIQVLCIAKTWYANEMPRPGCVWTHTLLTEKTNLAILDLEILLSLFTRPGAVSSILSYGRDVVIDESLTVNRNVNPEYLTSQVSVQMRVQTALFALPYKPIFSISSNARDFEYVPLGIKNLARIKSSICVLYRLFI